WARSGRPRGHGAPRPTSQRHRSRRLPPGPGYCAGTPTSAHSYSHTLLPQITARSRASTPGRRPFGRPGFVPAFEGLTVTRIGWGNHWTLVQSVALGVGAGGGAWNTPRVWYRGESSD